MLIIARFDLITITSIFLILFLIRIKSAQFALQSFNYSIYLQLISGLINATTISTFIKALYIVALVSLQLIYFSSTLETTSFALIFFVIVRLVSISLTISYYLQLQLQFSKQIQFVYTTVKYRDSLDQKMLRYVLISELRLQRTRTYSSRYDLGVVTGSSLQQ